MCAPRLPASAVRAWPVLLLLGWIPCDARALPPPAPKSEAPRAPKAEYRVYRLQQVRAAEAARVLDEAFNGRGARVPRLRAIADERTNSVIVSGTAPDLQTLEALLKQIDVPVPDSATAAPVLRVFRLQHVAADARLEAALQMVLDRRRPARFVVDRERRLVIAYADPVTLVGMENLLRELESEAGPGPVAAADLHLSVFWVVAGTGKKEGEPLPDNLQGAAAELGQLGIDRPRLEAQVSVTTTPDSRFEMTGLAGADTPYRLSVTGTIALRNGMPGLEVTVTAQRVTTSRDPVSVCRLSTRVTLPREDRPIVLGAAPADALRSAFVVQVQRPRPVPPGKKKTAFEFRKAPWRQVFEWLADRTGVPWVASTFPTGTFTFIPPRPDKKYSDAEVIDILSEALLAQKYLLLRRPGAFILAPISEFLDESEHTRGPVRPEDLGQYSRLEMVTIMVTLKSALAREAEPELKKMIGPYGNVAVLEKTNQVILQDLAGNLRRVYAALKKIDEGGNKQPPKRSK
jgi:type II secretory pathway component GspD/PulD (secretin)